MLDTNRKKLEELIYDILDIMGYTDLMGVVKMRLLDIPNEKVQEIVNKVAKTVKNW